MVFFKFYYKIKQEKNGYPSSFCLNLIKLLIAVRDFDNNVYNSFIIVGRDFNYTIMWGGEYPISIDSP